MQIEFIFSLHSQKDGEWESIDHIFACWWPESQS